MATIYVSAGATEYAEILVTETTGKDISADAAVVALVPFGQTPLSTDFGPADTKTNPTTSSVLLGLLVDNTVTPGNYSLWARLTDSPEIVPLKGPVVVVA